MRDRHCPIVSFTEVAHIIHVLRCSRWTSRWTCPIVAPMFGLIPNFSNIPFLNQKRSSRLAHYMTDYGWRITAHSSRYGHLSPKWTAYSNEGALVASYKRNHVQKTPWALGDILQGPLSCLMRLHIKATHVSLHLPRCLWC